MSINRFPSKKKSKIGRPQKHGGYSIVLHGKMPQNKRIRAYLANIRVGLIHDLGPAEADLTTAQLVTIDRAVTYLGAARSIEEWVSANGFFKDGKLNPAINEYYIAFCNGSLKCLQLLGLSRRNAEDVIDLGKYKEAKIKEKAAKATLEGPKLGQDERFPADMGDGQ